MKYSIYILIIAIVVYLWLNHEPAKPRTEPQATLLPAPATHHWVGKVGERRWVGVKEKRF